jgi:hypothetical protein
MFSTYRHNKKRNIGLLREFFSIYMAKAIVENRNHDFTMAKNLWLKYVNPKTKIYEEFQAFAALYEYSTDAREIGIELLKRTKQICEKQSQSDLDKEKTALLSEITRLPKSDNFFEQPVAGYKELATTQVLINAWRGTGTIVGNISEMVKLEEAVISNMAKEKVQIAENVIVEGNICQQNILGENKEQVDTLVLKLFFEKFNEKYGNLLNEQQSSLLKGFLFADTKKLIDGCKKLQEELVVEIDKALHSNDYQAFVKEKLRSIKEDVASSTSDVIKTNVVTEDKLAFFMSVCPLLEELRAPNNQHINESFAAARRIL